MYAMRYWLSLAPSMRSSAVRGGSMLTVQGDVDEQVTSALLHKIIAHGRFSHMKPVQS